ncbi:MAG: hypothetical protein RLZZ106_1352 [Cyanobacteriota bacterium]|jgi:hypothetical protein
MGLSKSLQFSRANQNPDHDKVRGLGLIDTRWDHGLTREPTIGFNMTHLVRLLLPLTLLLCLAPTSSEAVGSTDPLQDSQQEWVSRKSQSKGSSKGKKRNKHKHHQHAFEVHTAASLSA